MGESEKMATRPESAVPVGNLLSNVAPPSGLPTFVTSAVPPSQMPPSMQTQSSSSATVTPAPTVNSPASPPVTTPAPLPALPQASAAMQTLTLQPQEPTSPDRFSPAIPPSKGEPTVAIRSPDDSQATRSPVSLPDSEAEHIGDPMPGSGLLTWVRGAVSSTGPGWLHRVAEKAKSSVDSMITTLDPQMKEYLNNGGDVHIVVASDKEWDVSPVREAFQSVFGKATVVGMSVHVGDATAVQALEAGAALGAAKHRLAALRAQNQQIHNNTPLLAIEGYLTELPSDKWFEHHLLVLSHPALGAELVGVSQGARVPGAVLAALRAATPADYPHAGLALAAADLMAQNLQTSPADWQEAACSVSRREVLLLAARALAGAYRRLLALSSTLPPA